MTEDNNKLIAGAVFMLQTEAQKNSNRDGVKKTSNSTQNIKFDGLIEEDKILEDLNK